MLKHINKKKHCPVHPITDHAIVQFLQRSEIINIKAMRRQLMTKGLRGALKISKQDAQRSYQHNENGIHYIIKNGTVVTIMTYDDVREPNGELKRLQAGTYPI